MKRQAISAVSNAYLDKNDLIIDKMIRNMSDIPLIGSVWQYFSVQLTLLSYTEIELSENLLRYTTNVNVQNFAERFVCAESKRIAALREHRCDADEIGHIDSVGLNGQFIALREQMFKRVTNARRSNSIDASYICALLPCLETSYHFTKLALTQTLPSKPAEIMRSGLNETYSNIRALRRLRL